MAKLTRITGKVFGSNATATIGGIGQFGSAAAGSPNLTTDVATIQALPAYLDGWGSAVITSRNFPPIEEVTGVLKTISYQTCYTLQEGIPVYDIGTNYSDTSIVKVIDSNGLSFYRSLVEDNLGNSLSDTDYWALIPLANVQPQLAQKADVDLANTTPAQTFIDKSIGWTIPDYDNKITIASGADSGTYTCPADGWIFGVAIAGSSSGGAAEIFVNNLRIVYNSGGSAYQTTSNPCFMVNKDDIIDYSFLYPYGTAERALYFIPMKGQ